MSKFMFVNDDFLTWLAIGWRLYCWRISKQSLKILKRYGLKQQVSHHNKTQQRANRVDIRCDAFYLAFHKFRRLTCMTNILGSNPIWHKRNNESISCKRYPSWRHMTRSCSNHTWLLPSANIHTTASFNTHRGLNKMADIWQKTYSNAFSLI